MESDSSWARNWLDGKRAFFDLATPLDLVTSTVFPLLWEVTSRVLNRRRLECTYTETKEGAYWLTVRYRCTLSVCYAVRAVSPSEGLVEILLRELRVDEEYCRDDLEALGERLFLARGKAAQAPTGGRWDF